MDEIKPRIGKRMRFVLDVDKSDTFLLKDYKEGYAEWQKEQNKPKNKNRKNPTSNEKQQNS
jgi:hypothetical protein